MNGCDGRRHRSRQSSEIGSRRQRNKATGDREESEEHEIRRKKNGASEALLRVAPRRRHQKGMEHGLANPIGFEQWRRVQKFLIGKIGMVGKVDKKLSQRDVVEHVAPTMTVIIARSEREQ